MITVVGVRKIYVFECVSTSLRFLVKHCNHHRNGLQTRKLIFCKSINLDRAKDIL